MEINDIANSDIFFYYGQSDLKQESESDLLSLLLQPDRSMYYNRQESGGIVSSENHPSGLFFQIFLRFAIASAVAYRNSQVTNGSEGTKDRRIAVSQNSVNFRNSKSGEIDVNVLYFLYSDYSKPQILSVPVGDSI